MIKKLETYKERQWVLPRKNNGKTKLSTRALGFEAPVDYVAGGPYPYSIWPWGSPYMHIFLKTPKKYKYLSKIY